VRINPTGAARASKRRACITARYAPAQIVEQPFLVRAIVNETLQSAFAAGDKTNLERILQNNKFLIRKMEQELNENPKTPIFNLKDVEEMQSRMDQIPSRIEEAYRCYTAFCDEVVVPLFSEEIEFPPEVLAQAEKMIGKKIVPIKRNSNR
jgi:hypothetical protein